MLRIIMFLNNVIQGANQYTSKYYPVTVTHFNVAHHVVGKCVLTSRFFSQQATTLWSRDFRDELSEAPLIRVNVFRTTEENPEYPEH
jgi:hypothetical protein